MKFFVLKTLVLNPAFEDLVVHAAFDTYEEADAEYRNKTYSNSEADPYMYWVMPSTEFTKEELETIKYED